MADGADDDDVACLRTMPPPYVFQCELCGFNIRTKLSMNATDDEKESAQWAHSLMVTIPTTDRPKPPLPCLEETNINEMDV